MFPRTHKILSIKENKNRAWSKIQISVYQKGTKNEINRKDIDWEKIFTTNILDKRFVS